LNASLVPRIFRTMQPNLASASRLYGQPCPPSSSRNPPSWNPFVVVIALSMALCPMRLLAQSPSSEEWPQNHQDEPYAAEPEPDQAQPYGQEQPYTNPAPPNHQPLVASQLEQLVAPIALYPDALVAQILAASTYPQQVQEADRWRQSQGYVAPEQIASGADEQNWDPSVKALTAFPQVLAQMDRNLQWAAELGNAYYNQPQDVLEAVQVMRNRAQAAGTLRTTPQEVVQYDEGNIVLAPPTPEVVYVPAYNPWTVYGEPVSPYPGFSLLGAIADATGLLPLRYGLGIAMASFTQPWGWLAWGLDWLSHALLFNHSDYYSHSRTVADWGFPHRGFYAYRGREGFGGRGYARTGSGEPWHRGAFKSGGWHGFNRGPDRPVETWSGRSSRGFAPNRGFETSRGFESNRDFQARQGNGFLRPTERMPERRGSYRSDFNRGTQGFGRNENDRASARSFPRNAFGERPSGSFPYLSGKSHSSGAHLFGRGHSHDTFASVGHSHNDFAGGHGLFHSGGVHTPKSFGGAHGFGGGKGFGGARSHGGGHSGGGKHHH
jgi:hypothetical protein